MSKRMGSEMVIDVVTGELSFEAVKLVTANCWWFGRFAGGNQAVTETAIDDFLETGVFAEGLLFG